MQAEVQILVRPNEPAHDQRHVGNAAHWKLHSPGQIATVAVAAAVEKAADAAESHPQEERWNDYIAQGEEIDFSLAAVDDATPGISHSIWCAPALRTGSSGAVPVCGRAGRHFQFFHQLHVSRPPPIPTSWSAGMKWIRGAPRSFARLAIRLVRPACGRISFPQRQRLIEPRFRGLALLPDRPVLGRQSAQAILSP